MSKPMRNILSYTNGTVFKGVEIKNWIKYNVENLTSKTRIAKRMLKYMTIEDTADYKICKGTYESSASYNKYLVCKVG